MMAPGTKKGDIRLGPLLIDQHRSVFNRAYAANAGADGATDPRCILLGDFKSRDF
jgi:hypothetical protein